MSVSVCLSVCLSFCLSVCLSVSLSLSLRWTSSILDGQVHTIRARTRALPFWPCFQFTLLLVRPQGEAKTVLRNNFRTEWRQRLYTGTEEDSIHQLDRAAQVTIPRRWDRRGQHPPAGQSSPSHNLYTENWILSTPLPPPHTENFLTAQVLNPPTTSCSPVRPPPSPSTLWDTRLGSVWWWPTGSFGDRLRHCGRMRTSPYSPDWRSNMAGNAEEVRPQWWNWQTTKVTPHPIFLISIWVSYGSM